MSQKVTSKNLAYSSSLPPFLAALRAQASGASGPDPLAAAQRRSAKKRSSSEEAEDAPLVVDEHGNTVTVEVDKDGTVKETAAKAEDEAGPQDANSEDKSQKREGEAKSAIGGRKRKVGRVIGDAADETVHKDAPHSNIKDSKKPEASADKKVKKKAKKIKLSFDEDEG
ncbi:hypothetical protein TOPH_04565 [Tolypocladium ophioglossoides CBS 100239]|uniref:DUF4604 domain-containing protein n=1 Tax=Tolypocladium ophioglossoides (strain CBS 100239) TaxID=1163406 RepID=A0A0L0N973_TOLOC|nr:hypothetical protein TOPH_04565 [Tolypocladium ophioglossoides CBS 100239]